jgi:N-acetylglucosaminyldiphosphoundecaprenol N-acetyl-beta-D-mannosaminyltransferase
LSAKENPLLAAAIRGAGLVSADGMGVLLLARRLGHRFPERVTGIDTMRRVVNLAAQRGWPIFLLGAEAGVAEAAAQALKAEAPGLHVAGTAHGWFADAEAASVAEGVARSGASVLFVAMGTPRQEWFAAEFGERCGVRYVLGVGGAFDVLSGRRRRAPGLVQRAGLEWLFRWAQEPSRLAGRYGWGGFRFAREFLRARRGRG